MLRALVAVRGLPADDTATVAEATEIRQHEAWQNEHDSAHPLSYLTTPRLRKRILYASAPNYAIQLGSVVPLGVGRIAAPFVVEADVKDFRCRHLSRSRSYDSARVIAVQLVHDDRHGMGSSGILLRCGEVGSATLHRLRITHQYARPRLSDGDTGRHGGELEQSFQRLQPVFPGIHPILVLVLVDQADDHLRQQDHAVSRSRIWNCRIKRHPDRDRNRPRPEMAARDR